MGFPDALMSWVYTQDPQILEVTADLSQVRILLGELQISIDELQAEASAYISYQKQFKVIRSFRKTSENIFSHNLFLILNKFLLFQTVPNVFSWVCVE